jgi:predicted RNase H-like HicB family nuclease
MENFSFRLEWSDEDEGYIATCPEFPGLSAFGETPEEAIEEAQIALELFIEDHEESGETLPEPETVPEVSGQTRVRMPKSLHRDLKREAEREGTSLNSLIVSYLQRSLGRNEMRLGQEEIRLQLERLRRDIHRFHDEVDLVATAAEVYKAQSVVDQAGGPQDPLLRTIQATGSKDL